MITKLASLYFSGNLTFSTRSIKGFNTATLEIVVASGNTFSFTPYVTKNGNTAGSTDDIPVMYLGTEKIQKVVSLSEGKYVFNIDITGCTNIAFVRSGNFSSASINFRQAEFVAPTIEKEDGVFVLNVDNPTLDIESGKQIDAVLNSVDGGSTNILLEGSNDNFTTVDVIPMYNYKRNFFHNGTSSYALKANAGIVQIFANIEGYKNVRLRTEQQVGTCTISNLRVHQEVVEGRKILSGRADMFGCLNGYKYLKIRMLPNSIVNNQTKTSQIKDCSAYIRFRFDNTDLNPQLKYYNRGMVLAQFPTIYRKAGETENTVRGWELMNTAIDGGYIVEFQDTINATSTSIAATHNNRALTGAVCEQYFEIECYTHAPEPETILRKMYEKNDYDVYALPSTAVNRDVLNDDVLEWTDNSLTYWHGGYLGVKYEIPFTADNVNNFVEGEKINFAYLLPFKGTDMHRSEAVATENNPSRIVVFTDTRVFHNFPNRNGSIFPNSDVAVFDESRIFNSEKIWEPVNDKNKADSKHKYFPVLKEYDYNQFNGRVYGTEGFVDKFGNGGLPNNVLLQDIPKTGIKFWDRLRYSSMTKSDKYCAFGNYNTVAGSEPLVMVTNDGGVNWYVKAFFACVEDYDYMYGSKIDLTPITNVAPFVANSLKLCHKKYNIPTAETKEPTAPYIISQSEQSLITAIEYDSDENLVVTLADSIDFGSMLPLVFFENVSANEEWNYICNTGANERGTTNSYIHFRAIKVGDSGNKYKILANIGNNYAGNAGRDIAHNQSLICRHIHAVNAVEAGCLISTGESYSDGRFEGGFLYLIQQNKKNGTNTINISAGSIMGNVWRLCSSPDGVNRAAGAFIFMDDVDPTLLYISDECFPFANGANDKRYADIPGRTIKYPATPAGIFAGKLSDIDDQSKFKCVCELPMTGVGLLQSHGHFAADGHDSSVCLSKDGFAWEIDVNDGSYINGADKLGNIYFGNKVAIFK